MMNKLTLKLTSFISMNEYHNEKDSAKIQYGLSIILNEGFKIAFLLLFFNIIQNQNYFYFSLAVLLSTRTFAGGVHLKGALSCLILTTILFIFTSVLAPLTPKLPQAYYLLIAIACFAIVLVRAPICSVRRPIKDNKIRLQYKFIAALSISLWTIVLLFFKSTPYVNCGFSTILIQSIQLVLVKKPKL